MNHLPDETEFNQPPFPKLSKYAADALDGIDTFASCENFQANSAPSIGERRVIVHLESADDAKPSAAQINAYRYLKENEARVTAALLAGLYQDYPQIREAYGGIEPEYLPEIAQAADLRRAIEPLNVHINREAKDGCAYIGFECDCLWDEEHGLGVMMLRDEYVGCNDAEAAWNLDLARS